MAIFSLNHRFVGRGKSAPGSAGFYARYITRPEACTQTIGERMPTDRAELVAWLNDQEHGDRKNARIIDKVIVALPIELSHEQNVELLHAYGEAMTQGRACWVGAIHDGPSDADNPHAHIIFRDRDVETGRRVMMTTEAGSTQRFREGWQETVNLELERAGLNQRIDCRTLDAQGFDREPQLHVGPGAMALARRGYEFESNEQETTRIIAGHVSQVMINYPDIDQWKSRLEENEERILRNQTRQRLEQDSYPGQWTTNPTMPAQQAVANRWDDAAQNLQQRNYDRVSPVEQMSAMAWVLAANDRAEQLYQSTLNGQPVEDADPIEVAIVQDHVSERGVQRAAREAAREISDSNAEVWEARLSSLGRAMQQDAEQQRERDRDMGLEM